MLKEKINFKNKPLGRCLILILILLIELGSSMEDKDLINDSKSFSNFKIPKAKTFLSLKDSDTVKNAIDYMSSQHQSMKKAILELEDAFHVGQDDMVIRSYKKLKNIHDQEPKLSLRKKSLPEWHSLSNVPKILYLALYSNFHYYVLMRILAWLRLKAVHMRLGVIQLVEELSYNEFLECPDNANVKTLHRFYVKWLRATSDFAELRDKSAERVKFAIENLPFEVKDGNEDSGVEAFRTNAKILLEKLMIHERDKRAVRPSSSQSEQPDTKVSTISVPGPQTSSTGPCELLSNDSEQVLLFIDEAFPKGATEINNLIKWYKDAIEQLKNVIDDPSLDQNETKCLLLSLEGNRRKQQINVLQPIESFSLDVKWCDYQDLLEKFHLYEFYMMTCEDYLIPTFEQSDILEAFIAEVKKRHFTKYTVTRFLQDWKAMYDEKQDREKRQEEKRILLNKIWFLEDPRHEHLHSPTLTEDSTLTTIGDSHSHVDLHFLPSNSGLQDCEKLPIVYGVPQALDSFSVFGPEDFII